MTPELRHSAGGKRTGKFRRLFHAPVVHAALLLFAALPYWINLGKSSVWDANEAFYAETPREMLLTGDYLAPRFNNEPRTQKPPLAYWAVLLSYKLFGVGEFALRIPGAAAATVTLFLVYGIARMLFSPSAALMAAAVTATTPRFFVLARRLPIDILLILFLTAVLFFLMRAVRKNTTLDWAMVYFCAALGFLTKGPVAAVIPAGAYGAWSLHARRFRFAATHPWMGICIFLAVVLPWHVLIYKAHGWTYIAPFFMRDNLQRFALTSMGPTRGPLYYLPVFAMDFFPWSVLFLFAIYALWAGRKWTAPLKSPAYGLPIAWCALTFLLFSLSRNKQEYYIAPLYPAAAVLLAGIIMERRLAPGSPGKDIRDPGQSGSGPASPSASPLWSRAFLVLSLLLLAAFLPLPAGLRSFLPNLPPVLHYAPSLLIGAAAVLTAGSALGGRTARCFQGLAAFLTMLYGLCSLYYLPALEPYRPVRHFCSLIESRWQENDEAGYYRTALPSMAFYLRRPIFQEIRPEEMRRRFQSGRRVFCVLTDKDYRDLAADGRLVLHVLDRRPRLAVRTRAFRRADSLPEEELLLVSNRPDSAKDQRGGRSLS